MVDIDVPTDTTMTRTLILDDLPNEVLIMIFKRLYKIYRKRPSYYHCPLVSWSEAPADDVPIPDSRMHWEGDAFDPTMFPHAHVKVCRRWRTLLTRPDCAAYWTYIPITISSAAATSFSTVAYYFDMTRDLPIHVIIRRHPDDHRTEDPEEKAYINTLVPYLEQNIHRTIDLEMSLLHAASIPDIRSLFTGKTVILESLLISYKEGHSIIPLDEVHEVDAEGEESEEGEENEDDEDHDENDGDEASLEFSAPELTSLSIDAQNFAQICQSDEEWLAEAPQLTRISIIPPAHSSPTPHFSMSITLSALSHATHLFSFLIRGVHFLDDYTPPNPPPFIPELAATSLTFENLSGNALSSMLRAADQHLDLLAIKNCSLLGLGSVFKFAASLYLEGCDEGHDLTTAFRCMDSPQAEFIACPAFNDAFLDFLADGGPEGKDFPLESISTLSLTDCTNFDVDKLYRMIVARQNAFEANPLREGVTRVEDLPLHWEDVVPISGLYVSNGPVLSAEERARFEAVVGSFTWRSVEVSKVGGVA